MKQKIHDIKNHISEQMLSSSKGHFVLGIVLGIVFGCCRFYHVNDKTLKLFMFKYDEASITCTNKVVEYCNGNFVRSWYDIPYEYKIEGLIITI